MSLLWSVAVRTRCTVHSEPNVGTCFCFSATLRANQNESRKIYPPESVAQKTTTTKAIIQKKKKKQEKQTHFAWGTAQAERCAHSLCAGCVFETNRTFYAFMSRYSGSTHKRRRLTEQIYEIKKKNNRRVQSSGVRIIPLARPRRY